MTHRFAALLLFSMLLGCQSEGTARIAEACSSSSACAGDLTCSGGYCAGSLTIRGHVNGVLPDIGWAHVSLYPAGYVYENDSLPVFDPASATLKVEADVSQDPAPFVFTTAPKGKVTILAYQIGDPSRFTYPVALGAHEVTVLKDFSLTDFSLIDDQGMGAAYAEIWISAAAALP